MTVKAEVFMEVVVIFFAVELCTRLVAGPIELLAKLESMAAELDGTVGELEEILTELETTAAELEPTVTELELEVLELEPISAEAELVAALELELRA